MKPTQTRPTCYTIRVEGYLAVEWAEWFEGLAISQENGETLLTGPVTDQAALYGLLKRVRDFGLALIAVNRLPAENFEVRSKT